MQQFLRECADDRIIMLGQTKLIVQLCRCRPVLNSYVVDLFNECFEKRNVQLYIGPSSMIIIQCFLIGLGCNVHLSVDHQLGFGVASIHVDIVKDWILGFVRDKEKINLDNVIEQMEDAVERNLSNRYRRSVFVERSSLIRSLLESLLQSISKNAIPITNSLHINKDEVSVPMEFWGALSIGFFLDALL